MSSRKLRGYAKHNHRHEDQRAHATDITPSRRLDRAAWYGGCMAPVDYVSEAMSQQQTRALILDDDRWIGELLRAQLQRSRPSIEAVLRTEPDCSGEFDIYFVDNCFCGQGLATELVHEIRRDHPNALIVVFSGKLDRPDLINLIRADCDLVCEKHAPNALASMLRDVQRLLLAPRRTKHRRRSLGGTIRGLADLIYQLNSKLNNRAAQQEELDS